MKGYAGFFQGRLAAAVAAVVVASPAVGAWARPTSQSPHRPPPGQLELAGTWAGVDFARALARRYESRAAGVYVSVSPRDSADIADLLARGSIPLGLVLDCQVPTVSHRLGLEFERQPLGHFVLVVVTHAGNPARRITMDELAAVYRGRIRSWQEIENSGTAWGMEVYAPLLTSTEGLLFRERVLRGAPYAASLRRSRGEGGRQKLSSEEVVGAVAQRRNAIGFLMLGYDTQLDKRVRMMRVAATPECKPVLPAVPTIRDGTYPLSDTLSIYVHAAAPPIAWDFSEYARGPEAVGLARAARLFPDHQWQEHVAKLRHREAAAGRGERVRVSGPAATRGLVRDLAEEFVRRRQAVQVQYRPASPIAAMKEFLDGGDLLLHAGPLDERTRTVHGARWDALGAQAAPLGRMAVGIVVHPANPVDTLTMDQLQALFTGRGAAWSEVGGPPGVPVRLYGLSASSPADVLLREKLGVNRLSLRMLRRADTANVAAGVSRDTAALGFVDLSGLSPRDGSVKLLKLIGPEKPFAVSARGDMDEYPLAEPYTLYLSPEAGDAARELARFVVLGHGAEVIARHGLLPAAPPLPATARTAR